MYKVTIMIPTYNQEKYIEEAILSALSQNYEDLEVVVCDDCSNDSTWKIVKSIKDKRLKKHRNFKNIGRVNNYRKLLFELASGDYVINLDGDDYFIDNDYIKNAIKLAEKENLDLVFANQIVKSDSREKSTKMHLPTIMDGRWLFLNYGKCGIHIPHLTALYNRKKALELNFYRKNIISSDWESLLRLILTSKVGFISNEVGVWRQISNSQSKSGSIEDYIENVNSLVDVINNDNGLLTKKEKTLWKERMIKNLVLSIPVSLYGCRFSEIFAFAKKSLKLTTFLQLLFNYRFIAKTLKGKFINRCAEL